jgi:lipid A 3-O-deacylase
LQIAVIYTDKRENMNNYLNSLILLIATFGWIATETVQADEAPEDVNQALSRTDGQHLQRERPTWRFEIANDLVFDSDNQFSNGLTFQKHSTIGGDLNDLQGVRAFGKGLARKLLPQDNDLVYRKALTVGQILGTPDDLEDPDIILDDAPYFGMLAGQSSWIAFNDTSFTGFAMMIGIVGEYSFAEEVQTGFHSLIDATEPQGWEHQIETEPVLNFYYMKKRKLWNKPSFDGAFNFDVSVGNFITGVDAGIEMRFGRKPGGFSYIPDAIGRSMAYDATLARDDGRTEIYGTLSARAWAWAVFMPAEGNTFVSGNEWTDNNTIDPEKVIGQLTAGFHFVRPSWGLHFTWTFATDNVDQDSLSPGMAVENNYGFIMFEWRFR